MTVESRFLFGTTYQAPQLTGEQTWDIAAFINSQPRSNRQFPADWPDVSKKPFDYPFAPYSDDFSDQQYKYGPYGAMVKK